MLASVIRGPLDERVRERLVAETRGNPLALVELPRGLAPGELAGGFGLLDAPALSGRIEESFRRRLRPLPDDTQRLLLVAAAEPAGEPILLWRAAERLGIGRRPLPSPIRLVVASRRAVRFRHPLVRAAAYRAASLATGRAYRALAEATTGLNPHRRAWHRAQAAAGPDEDVAAGARALGQSGAGAGSRRRAASGTGR